MKWSAISCLLESQLTDANWSCKNTRPNRFFYYPKYTARILEFLLIEDGYDLNSDHYPVYVTIHKTTAENLFYSFGKFRQILSSEVYCEPSNSDEIENCATLLTNAMQRAAWNSTLLHSLENVLGLTRFSGVCAKIIVLLL